MDKGTWSHCWGTNEQQLRFPRSLISLSRIEHEALREAQKLYPLGSKESIEAVASTIHKSVLIVVYEDLKDKQSKGRISDFAVRYINAFEFGNDCVDNQTIMKAALGRLESKERRRLIERVLQHASVLQLLRLMSGEIRLASTGPHQTRLGFD